jgi:hypothetical protein
VLGSLDDLPRIYAATGFHRILIAADAISEDRLTMVKAFTDAHHMPLQRFSIEVNEFVPAIANGSSNGDGRGDGKSDNKPGNKSDSEIAVTEAPPGSVVRPSIA